MDLLLADAWFRIDNVPPWLMTSVQFLKVLLGFSIIIFVHELGHFLAAKWVGVRVDRFAVGFGYRLFGWRKGEGFTFGNRPNYAAEQLAEKSYGETDYCFKALPIGGYVKMLGQEDINIDEKSGEITMTTDPRAFTNRTVGQRMLVVSAGVVMNLLFAALAFMTVFLIGIKLEAPVLGDIEPDGPAARAGLRPGDKVLTIDGSEINTFRDIFVAQVLADGPLTFQIERRGQVLEDKFVVEPEWSQDNKIRTIGASPLFTTVLTREGDAVDGFPNLQAGDKIVSVDDQPVETEAELLQAFMRGRGGSAKVTAQRPNPADSDKFELVETRQRTFLAVDSAEAPSANFERTVDDRHILGLRARRVVASVPEGEPADIAGFKSGDVIVEWDSITAPNWTEIIESIQSKPNQPIRAVVERGAEFKTLTVMPKRKFTLFGSDPPRVGLEVRGPESAKPIVADVVPGTPAAALRLPRGSLILSVAGESLANWYDLIDILREHAGRTVDVRFKSGQDEVSAPLVIPSSIVNELDLPPDTLVKSIDGQTNIVIARPDGSGKSQDTTFNLPAAIAVKELLRKNIGKTVNVRYQFGSQPSVEKPFTVTAENFDPWQMRIRYVYDFRNRFSVAKTTVQANRNPVKAIWMGVKLTAGNVVQIYQAMKHMAKQNVSPGHIQGPIGIFSQAIEVARDGFVDLIFFLAFLSVNLAVVNFLPLPVVDGGLMVFLLIEKIKGKPLSLKTQMVSTIVGLAMIVLCFLAVTFNDILRFF